MNSHRSSQAWRGYALANAVILLAYPASWPDAPIRLFLATETIVAGYLAASFWIKAQMLRTQLTAESNRVMTLAVEAELHRTRQEHPDVLGSDTPAARYVRGRHAESTGQDLHRFGPVTRPPTWTRQQWLDYSLKHRYAAESGEWEGDDDVR